MRANNPWMGVVCAVGRLQRGLWRCGEKPVQGTSRQKHKQHLLNSFLGLLLKVLMLKVRRCNQRDANQKKILLALFLDQNLNACSGERLAIIRVVSAKNPILLTIFWDSRLNRLLAVRGGTGVCQELLWQATV